MTFVVLLLDDVDVNVVDVASVVDVDGSNVVLDVVGSKINKKTSHVVCDISISHMTAFFDF